MFLRKFDSPPLFDRQRNNSNNDHDNNNNINDRNNNKHHLIAMIAIEPQSEFLSVSNLFQKKKYPIFSGVKSFEKEIKIRTSLNWKMRCKWRGG